MYKSIIGSQREFSDLLAANTKWVLLLVEGYNL